MDISTAVREKNSLEVVDLHIQPTTDNVTDMLHGYIRQGTYHHPHATMDCATPSLSQITEQNDDIVVETLQQPPETTLQPQSSSSTTSSSLPPMLERNTRNKNVIERSLEVLQSSSRSWGRTNSVPSSNGQNRQSFRSRTSHPLSSTFPATSAYAPIQRQALVPEGKEREDEEEEEEEEIEFHDVAETTDDVLFNNIHD